jgi:hypothetical protein
MEEETTKRIIEIEVDTDNAIQSLRELGEQVAKNNTRLDELKKQGKENSDEFIKLANENKVLTQQMRQTEKQIQNNIKRQKAEADSLVDLRAKLSNLNKQYDSMGGMERMGKQGQDLQKQIKALSDEIMRLEGETGRWQRNVGNYKSALKGLKDGFEAAGVGTKGLNSAMKILSTNPIMTIVNVLTLLFVKLSDKMKGTTSITDALHSAMKALKPMMDTMSKVVSKLADVFSNVLDWAIERTIEGIEALGRLLQRVGRVFGKEWGTGLVDFSYKMREARSATDDTTEAIEESVEAVKTHTKAVKEDTKAIEDNAAQLAKQEEEYRKLTIAEMQKAEDALNSIIEDAFKKREAIENTAYQRQHDKLLEAMVAEEEARGTETELYKAYMTQWEALETQHANNLLAIENDRIAKEQAAKDAAEKKDAERIKREIELEYSKYENVAKITGSIGDILAAASDDNEALVKASKIAALAEVAIQQGIAISKAVASAAGVPYPANIHAIASSVASAIAAIVPALQSINSVKLARGTSYVQGPGTTTSDSVPAMLSKGEGVVNAKANSMFPGVVGAMNDASVGIWSPLMSMLRNSGGAPAQVASPMQMSEVQMAEAFRNAVADLDIYVSVDEINRGQKSVKVVENLGAM